MTNEITKECIRILENYYTYNEISFVEFLDDNVTWYGPLEGQVVCGKEKLIAALTYRKSKLNITVTDVHTNIFPLRLDALIILLEYRLTTLHQNGKVKSFRQHMLISLRKRVIDGVEKFTCPLIHVSNTDFHNVKSDSNDMMISEEDRRNYELFLRERLNIKKLSINAKTDRLFSSRRTE